VLFDRIRAMGDEDQRVLDSLEAPVWETWSVVEEVAARYGIVRSETPD
jgi:hypothetical protein